MNGVYRGRFGSLIVFLFSCLFTLATATAATDTPKHVPGDFNGDGIPDVLVQPVDATSPTQVLLGDVYGQPTIASQSLNAGYLGLGWGQDQSHILAGDFTGTGRSDLLLQALTPGGTTAFLLADPNGQFSSVYQQFSGPYLGLDWSTAGHHILAGDFAGTGHQALLLQTTAPGGINEIVEADAQGQFDAAGQAWLDGYLGLPWSTQDVTLYSGDFTGNGRTDLLVQVNAPSQHADAPAYALLLADPSGEFTAIDQSWNTDAYGADWSPATHTLSVEDVAGTGVDDIVLTANDANGTNYLFLGTPTGIDTQPDLTWTGAQSAKAAWANKLAASAQVSVVAGPTTNEQTLSAAPQTLMQTETLQPVTAVGTIAGSFSVSPLGQATYSMPLSAPGGAGGLAPHLSLVYAGGSGPGLLGWDMTVGGLSSITRCGSNPVYGDASTSAVTLTTDDRFCLDGQELTIVGGSPEYAYGMDGIEYVTTPSNQMETISHTSDSALGPDSFTVLHPDGSIWEYGANGAEVTATTGTGTVGRIWELDQIKDANNNLITFHYTLTGGTAYLNEVDWGGNSGQGTSADHSLVFGYTTVGADATQYSYLVGHLITWNRRLNAITLNYNGSAVLTWTPSYLADGQDSNRNRVSAIQECDAGGDCFPATTFTWQQGTPGYATSQNTGISVGTNGYHFVADVNGDGLDDFIFDDNGTWAELFGVAGGGFDSTIHSTGIAVTDTTQVQPIHSLATAGDQILVSGAGTGLPGLVQAADINGDGLDDLVTVVNGTDAQGNATSSLEYMLNTTTGSGGATYGPLTVAYTYTSWIDVLGGESADGEKTSSPSFRWSVLAICADRTTNCI